LTTNAIIAGLQLRNENGIRTILDSVKFLWMPAFSL